MFWLTGLKGLNLNLLSCFLNLKSWTQLVNKTLHLSFLSVSCTRSLIHFLHYFLHRHTVLGVFRLPLQIHNPASSALLCTLWEPDFCEPPQCALLLLDGFDSGKHRHESKGWEESRVRLYITCVSASQRPRFGCDSFPLLKITASVSQPSLYRSLQVLLTTDC